MIHCDGRRFPKRIMIPLPDEEARVAMIKRLLQNHHHSLSNADFEEVATVTEGYSGSDLTALAKDAAMGPIREIDPAKVATFKHKEVRATFRLSTFIITQYLTLIFVTPFRFAPSQRRTL